MKKRAFLAGWFAFILVFSTLLAPHVLVSAVQAAQISDFSNHPAKADIAFALKEGYMWNYPDGKFYPANQIPQAQFVASLAAIRGVKETAPVPKLPSGHWAKAVYERAQKAGILADVTIDPNRLLTKEEVAKLVFNAWKPYRGEKHKNYTNTGALITWGWMKPYLPGPKFREDLPVTRGEAAEILRFLWQDKWQLEMGARLQQEFHSSLKLVNGVITGRVPKADRNFMVDVTFVTKENGPLIYRNGQSFNVDLKQVSSFTFFITNAKDSSDAGTYRYEGLPSINPVNLTQKFH
ncbi:S-layer homology domain-containing protein [Brevibacillus sp. H7]|uniref:S-layer homology domain-containing protein n=1 Tax=Brevibacillus sp. H7 TaxID=3349138 RepID=UPI0038235713